MKLENYTVHLEDRCLSVVCDLLINEEVDTSTHPDDILTSYVTTVDVIKISMVEVHVYNKGLDITKDILYCPSLKKSLENDIVIEMEYTNLRDLKAA